MLSQEKIVEKGTVVEINEKSVNVVMMKNDHCESCGSMFCNLNGKEQPVVETQKREDIKVGDIVEVTIGGDQVLNISFFIYGVPIIILIATIIVGLRVFTGANAELLSVGIAVGIIVVYYFIFNLVAKRIKDNIKLPKITRKLSIEDISNG
jgi:positive regulator of sigma E activity